jgi:hypothetical protein
MGAVGAAVAIPVRVLPALVPVEEDAPPVPVAEFVPKIGISFGEGVASDPTLTPPQKVELLRRACALYEETQTRLHQEIADMSFDNSLLQAKVEGGRNLLMVLSQRLQSLELAIKKPNGPV